MSLEGQDGQNKFTSFGGGEKLADADSLELHDLDEESDDSESDQSL